jgi:hypothetical protein
VEQAKAMLTVAKDCGVNAVKLQKRSNRTLYTRAFFDQPYDNEFSFGPTYGEHREALELGREEYAELQRYAREIGMTLFATPFDFESADFLAKARNLSAAEGDLLAVMSAGAYGMSMSSNYNSRPRAAEVLVDGAAAHLVRRRETVEELFALERVEG